MPVARAGLVATSCEPKQCSLSLYNPTTHTKKKATKRGKNTHKKKRSGNHTPTHTETETQPDDGIDSALY